MSEDTVVEPSNRWSLPLAPWNSVATLILFALFVWDRTNGSRDASLDIKNLAVQTEKRVTAMEISNAEKNREDAKFRYDIMQKFSEMMNMVSRMDARVDNINDYYKRAQRQP